jgi:hypothetical protein
MEVRRDGVGVAAAAPLQCVWDSNEIEAVRETVLVGARNDGRLFDRYRGHVQQIQEQGAYAMTGWAKVTARTQLASQDVVQHRELSLDVRVGDEFVFVVSVVEVLHVHGHGGHSLARCSAKIWIQILLDDAGSYPPDVSSLRESPGAVVGVQQEQLVLYEGASKTCKTSRVSYGTSRQLFL